MKTIYTNRDFLANQRISPRERRPMGRWLILSLFALLLIWGVWPDGDPDAAAEDPENTEEFMAEAAADGEALGGPLDDPIDDTAEVVPEAALAEDEAIENEAHLLDIDDTQADEALAFDTSDDPEGKLIGPKSLARTESGRVESGETLIAALGRYDIPEAVAEKIFIALRGTYDFRKLKAGTRFEVKLNPLGGLDGFQLFETALETYYVRREGEGYLGYAIKGETTMYVVPVSGVIEKSLAHSVWELGEGEALTAMIAGIFVWDIDFFSDLQKGDEWHVLVEKHFYNGKFVRYGDILCAKLVGAAIGTRYAYYFGPAGGKYFDDKGYALEKSFLRAPLDTTRVTSRFGFRMHPTLGKRKKHNGVDYGAPRGTPVWAIASGRVTAAGRMGPCGNGVKIRHRDGYESIYCHLSSVALHRGQKVRQKALVGRVGCTGRCTGPHLHFGLKRNGTYVNPLEVKMLPTRRMERKHTDRWKDARALLKGKLDALATPDFFGPPRPPDYEPPAASAPRAAASPARRSPPKSGKGFRPRPEGINEVRMR